MTPTEFWRWRVTSETTGRKCNTKHLMVEADALRMDPAAKRVPGTLEVRNLPDGPDEYVYTSLGRPQDPTG